MKAWRALAAATAFAGTLAGSTLAGPAADKTASYLYAGTLAAGESELQGLVTATPGDAEAKAGLGAIRFAKAMETFAQAMYRHGLQPGGDAYGPLLRMPILANPNPQPLTYQELRNIFSKLSADLELAEKTLADVGDAQIKLPLATGRIRIDVNGDGQAGDNEQLIALAFGDNAPTEFREQTDKFVVAFDTADIYWLRGYSHLLGSVADFWLAFDFENSFNQTFHLIFPRAQLPNGAALATGANVMGMEADGIADFIALIHLMNWKVVDRDRLERLRQHLLQVIALNRKTWDAARAETDNDREWLPSPTQKIGVMGLEVTQERLDVWLRSLAEVENVLEGRKLLPHWRFSKGINVKRALAEAQDFDFVLWVTGQGVLPYLETGPMADSALFEQADRIFAGNLLTYAFWFN